MKLKLYTIIEVRVHRPILRKSKYTVEYSIKYSKSHWSEICFTYSWLTVYLLLTRNSHYNGFEISAVSLTNITVQQIHGTKIKRATRVVPLLAKFSSVNYMMKDNN